MVDDPVADYDRAVDRARDIVPPAFPHAAALGGFQASTFIGPPTRRLVTPCMNSWKTTVESNAVCRSWT